MPLTGARPSKRDYAFGHSIREILWLMGNDLSIIAANDLHLVGVIDLLNLQSFELAKNGG
jgi:hypothetical protein